MSDSTESKSNNLNAFTAASFGATFSVGSAEIGNFVLNVANDFWAVNPEINLAATAFISAVSVVNGLSTSEVIRNSLDQEKSNAAPVPSAQNRYSGIHTLTGTTIGGMSILSGSYGALGEKIGNAFNGVAPYFDAPDIALSAGAAAVLYHAAKFVYSASRDGHAIADKRKRTPAAQQTGQNLNI